MCQNDDCETKTIWVPPKLACVVQEDAKHQHSKDSHVAYRFTFFVSRVVQNSLSSICRWQALLPETEKLLSICVHLKWSAGRPRTFSSEMKTILKSIFFFFYTKAPSLSANVKPAARVSYLIVTFNSEQHDGNCGSTIFLFIYFFYQQKMLTFFSLCLISRRSYLLFFFFF